MFSRRLLLFILLSALTSGAVAQRNSEFEPGCDLPFKGIEVRRWIDGYCGSSGSASSRSGKVQNRAKNEFCATGDPIDLTLEAFRALQQAADDAQIYRAPKGIPSPRWRAKLRDIWTSPAGRTVGEGKVVRFTGYVNKVFTAVPDVGESVNCRTRGEANNDIHLELAEALKPDKCDRLVTEISPHFRPAEWTVENLRRVATLNLPVRVTGHLFWDASHSPCGPGEPEQWRATTWEIHPVYRIEVCRLTDLTECRATASAQWTPLHEWPRPPTD